MEAMLPFAKCMFKFKNKQYNQIESGPGGNERPQRGRKRGQGRKWPRNAF